MSANAPIKFIPTTIPAGVCFTSEQDRYNFFAKNLRGYLPGTYSTFNYGSTEPAAEDRDKPWIKLFPDGSLDKTYVYFGGAWVAPHAFSQGIVAMWEGVIAALDTFDGGAVGAVTDTTGPMWQVVAEFAAKFPVGVGNFDSGTAVNAGDAGGEEKHKLVLTEIPPHSHLIANKDSGAPGSGLSPTNYMAASGRNSSSSTEYSLVGTSNSPVELKTGDAGGTGSPADAQPHNNLPPYRGIYFIRRTARRFYTA